MNEPNSHLNLLINILDDFIQFLEPYKFLLDTHNIQFIIDNHWSNEAIINEKLRKELETLIHIEKNEINLLKLFSNTDTQQSSVLNNLFNEIKTCRSTWTEKILTDLNFLFERHHVSEKMKEEFEKKFDTMKKQNRFMNQKKVYEVDTMSLFVAKLCNHLKIGTVI